MDREAKAKALQQEAQEHMKRAIDWMMAGDWFAADDYLLATGAALNALSDL